MAVSLKENNILCDFFMNSPEGSFLKLLYALTRAYAARRHELSRTQHCQVVNFSVGANKVLKNWPLVTLPT
jgi:hypothetical protein